MVDVSSLVRHPLSWPRICFHTSGGHGEGGGQRLWSQNRRVDHAMREFELRFLFNLFCFCRFPLYSCITIQASPVLRGDLTRLVQEAHIIFMRWRGNRWSFNLCVNEVQSHSTLALPIRLSTIDAIR